MCTSKQFVWCQRHYLGLLINLRSGGVGGHCMLHASTRSRRSAEQRRHVCESCVAHTTHRGVRNFLGRLGRLLRIGDPHDSPSTGNPSTATMTQRYQVDRDLVSRLSSKEQFRSIAGQGSFVSVGVITR